MTPTTLSTVHANEVIVVEGALDPQGRANVTLGLVNQDRSDTFPGRTLSPDQADELAASLVLSAAARARAPVSRGAAYQAPHEDTLMAIRAAVPLSSHTPPLGQHTHNPPERMHPDRRAGRAPGVADRQLRRAQGIRDH